MFLGNYEAKIKDGKVYLPQEFKDSIKIDSQYFVVLNSESVNYYFEPVSDVKVDFQGTVDKDFALFIPTDFLKNNEAEKLILCGVMNSLSLCKKQEFSTVDLKELLSELGI